MNRILKLEEFAQMVASLLILFNISPGYEWWVYLILFFLPDMSFLGYSVSPKAGAVFYNLLHHKGFALLMIGIGWVSGNIFLLITGLMFFSHSSFDRVLGYGLKYADSFKNTHLGVIGK